MWINTAGLTQLVCSGRSSAWFSGIKTCFGGKTDFSISRSVKRSNDHGEYNSQKGFLMKGPSPVSERIDSDCQDEGCCFQQKILSVWSLWPGYRLRLTCPDHCCSFVVLDELEHQIWMHNEQRMSDHAEIGNRYECCCLISILTTFRRASLIYYRSDNMFELVSHCSVHAGPTSLASPRPECPHHFLCISDL